MPLEYLHTMVRVRDLDASLRFFELLGLVELRRTAYSVEKKRAFYQERAAYFSQYLNTC